MQSEASTGDLTYESYFGFRCWSTQKHLLQGKVSGGKTERKPRGFLGKMGGGGTALYLVNSKREHHLTGRIKKCS